MTRLEIIAYYEALNASDRLIIVDVNDSRETILQKLTETKDYDGTIHIEIIKNDESIGSYSLVKNGVDTYDLWASKQKHVDQKPLSKVSKHIYEHLPSPAKSPYDKYIAEKKSQHVCIIKSFSDPEYSEEVDMRNLTLDQMMSNRILGHVIYDNGVTEYHVINNTDISVFDDLLKHIHNDKIRLFASTCLKLVPQYVFEVPAGISGVKNSASDVSDGGLLRYIINSTNLLIRILDMDYAKIKFTQHEIDMMIVAILFCDMFKHGWQEDYEQSHLPKPDHPRFAANVIRSMTHIISAGELNFIANCIESHMGQFASKKVKQPLPAPDTDYKYMVQLAHHLASLTDINFINNDVLHVFSSQPLISVETFATTSPKEHDALIRAAGMPIDMEIARSLGINHSEEEINDVWNTIIESKRASKKQIKYIELARRLVFDL